jgi:cytochrome c oxidase subunit 4
MSEEHAHIVPYKTFAIVWIGLLILTGITVAVAQYNLGPLNIWVALGIATLKAGLVVAVFMHRKYCFRRWPSWQSLSALPLLMSFTVRS